jgi:hypothetical protein
MDAPSTVLGCLECGGCQFYLLPKSRIICANEDCGAILIRSGSDFEVHWQTSSVLRDPKNSP